MTGKNIRAKMRYLWKVSAGQRRYVVLTCVMGICSVLFSLAFIGVSKRVIDIATRAVEGNLRREALLLAALLLLQLACNVMDSWVGVRMQVELGNGLRQGLFTRLLRSRWNELECFHTGDIVNRVEQDTSSVVGLLTGTFPSLVVTGVQLLAAFLFFCYLLHTHTLNLKPDGFHTGQCTYGDSNMHFGFITSLATQQTFPPNYSISPSDKLCYPFLCDSISASIYLFALFLYAADVLCLFAGHYRLLLHCKDMARLSGQSSPCMGSVLL